MTTVTKVFVCVSCKRARVPASSLDESRDAQNDDERLFDHPGPALAASVRALLADDPLIDVVEVDCLAVCKRPCTVALAGDGKWTYVVGDLDNVAHCAEVASAARAFANSENGIVPWKERPATFRKGVISRIPPITFVQPEPAE